MTVSSDSVAQDQLISLVRRIESLEDEAKAINDDKSEVYKEARGNGFDVKVLRKIVADRRKDNAERTEFQAVYDLYWAAIHGVAPAHVEIIEEFSVDEFGEIREESSQNPSNSGAVTASTSSIPGEKARAVSAVQ